MGFKGPIITVCFPGEALRVRSVLKWSNRFNWGEKKASQMAFSKFYRTMEDSGARGWFRDLDRKQWLAKECSSFAEYAARQGLKGVFSRLPSPPPKATPDSYFNEKLKRKAQPLDNYSKVFGKDRRDVEVLEAAMAFEWRDRRETRRQKFYPNFEAVKKWPAVGWFKRPERTSWLRA